MIPLRTCVGCFGKFPKQDLVRIIRNKKGEVQMTNNVVHDGRGVYLCKKQACLEKVFNRKGRDGVSHGLKVKIGGEKLTELKDCISALMG